MKNQRGSMKELSFEQLVENISWDKPVEIQKQAMEEILRVTEEQNISKLIVWENKSTWENAAKIVLKLGYPKTKPLLPELLGFYQDINWPGVPEVTEALGGFDKGYLIDGIEKAAKAAIDGRDYGWIFGLNFLTNELKLRRDEFKEPRLYDHLRDNEDKW